MISLTENAANRIKELFKEKSLPETAAIRFSVKGGGCSGFSMEVKLEQPRRYDMANRFDNKFISNGIRILVDKKSLLFLDGTAVDWEQTQFGHKFKYDNPQATGWCGCQESFAV